MRSDSHLSTGEAMHVRGGLLPSEGGHDAILLVKPVPQDFSKGRRTISD